MLRGRDPERLHALREREAVARLDEHVDVRALDAELDDVKALLELPHGDQRLANRVKDGRLAQGSDRCMGAHDDVSRPVGT